MFLVHELFWSTSYRKRDRLWFGRLIVRGLLPHSWTADMLSSKSSSHSSVIASFPSLATVCCAVQWLCMDDCVPRCLLRPSQALFMPISRPERRIGFVTVRLIRRVSARRSFIWPSTSAGPPETVATVLEECCICIPAIPCVISNKLRCWVSILSKFIPVTRLQKLAIHFDKITQDSGC